MTDNEAEVIRPVSAPEHIEADAPISKGDFYSRCVFWLAVLIGLAAFVFSCITFAGFAENDQNATHLMSAFGVSFGTGALAFGPMTLIALYARKAIYRPLPRFRAVIVLLLMLPWFVLGFYIYSIGDIWRLIAVFGGLATLFITLWALRFMNVK